MFSQVTLKETREDFPIGDHYNISIRACQAISEKAYGKNEKKLIASMMRKTRDFIHEVGVLKLFEGI